jgi:ABC-type Zn2+ transport system substrate-binding protein/surface adhesin
VSNKRLFVFDEPRFNPNIINDITNDFGFKVQTFIEPAPYVNYEVGSGQNIMIFERTVGGFAAAS